MHEKRSGSITIVLQSQTSRKRAVRKICADLRTSTKPTSLLKSRSGIFFSGNASGVNGDLEDPQSYAVDSSVISVPRIKEIGSGREGLRCALRQMTSAVSRWRRGRMDAINSAGRAKDEYTLAPSRTRVISSDLRYLQLQSKIKINQAAWAQECAPRVCGVLSTIICCLV